MIDVREFKMKVMSHKFFKSFFALSILCVLIVATEMKCTKTTITSFSAVKVHEITLKPQLTSKWCYAAVVQMILNNLGISKTQCKLVTIVRFQTYCQSCDDLTKSSECLKGCNYSAEPGSTEDLLNSLKTRLGNLQVETYQNITTWDSLKKIIDLNPLAFIYKPENGNALHAVVINGYKETKDKYYVSILDPWKPCEGNMRYITFDEYKSIHKKTISVQKTSNNESASVYF